MPRIFFMHGGQSFRIPRFVRRLCARHGVEAPVWMALQHAMPVLSKSTVSVITCRFNFRWRIVRAHLLFGMEGN
jgi:hypothetical protein